MGCHVLNTKKSQDLIHITDSWTLSSLTNFVFVLTFVASVKWRKIQNSKTAFVKQYKINTFSYLDIKLRDL